MVLAAALVSLAGCSAGDPVSNARQTARGLDAIAGLPQDGFTLGASNAPWTLSVMSTPTSYELDQLITLLPSVTDGFVRDGRLKLQMRTPTRGPYGANGEERAASGALLAAGLQGRYWDALIRFVANYAWRRDDDRAREPDGPVGRAGRRSRDGRSLQRPHPRRRSIGPTAPPPKSTARAR